MTRYARLRALTGLDPLHWLMQGLISIDQLGNWFITPFSRDVWADETVSGRAYRGSLRGNYAWFAVRLILDTLAMPFGDGHCKHAFESERLRRQSPPSERTPS